MKYLLSKYTIGSLGFLFFLFTVARGAHAAENVPSDERNVVGLMVGQAWSAGQLGSLSDNGTVSPGIFYEYEASEVFSLYAQDVFANYNNGALKTNSTNVGMKAHLVYYDKLAPFVLVGAGLYEISEGNTPSPPVTASKTLFGLHLGAGADLDLSDRFVLGLQFDVHTVFSGTATTSLGNVNVSGRWTGFFLRGGVRL